MKKPVYLFVAGHEFYLYSTGELEIRKTDYNPSPILSRQATRELLRFLVANMEVEEGG
jgi:hypothetical protein